MKEPETILSEQPIPALELLGGLSSRLIHDLTNYLCIISGNTRFLEQFPKEAENGGGALQAIAQAAQKAGKFLERCGEIRGGMSHRLPVTSIDEVVSALARRKALIPRWKLAFPEPADGYIPLSTGWAVGIILELVKAAQAETGDIRFTVLTTDLRSCNRPLRRSASSATQTLEIALIYAEGQLLTVQEIKSNYDRPLLMAGYELIYQANGWLEPRTGPNGRHQLAVNLPILKVHPAGRSGDCERDAY